MLDGKLKNWRDITADGKSRFRFDFVSDVISTDDKNQTAKIRMEADPRRYTVSVVDGKRCYIDKFLSIVIPESVMLDAMKNQLAGLPISYRPPSIASASGYAKSRNLALNLEFSGSPYVPPNEEVTPQTELTVASEDNFISFLSVDIVGSTVLRQIHGERFDESYNIFLRELITSVGHFHGAILNVTGDGFIAFLDLPGFTTQCDNTVDLGLTLLEVLRKGVNPSLKSAGLPELNIRIGADVGTARKRLVNVLTTKYQSFDIGSAAINRAVKIEKVAKSGQFLLGQALFELLHVQWLERCRPVSFDGLSVGIPDYKIYRIL